MSGGEGRQAMLIAAAFLVSAAASIGLAVVYAMGGQAQIEGALLGVSLGGMALGLTLFAKRFLPVGDAVEEREVVPEVVERPEAAQAFAVGAEPIARRSLLAKALGAALAAFGLAALFPIRSLGHRPGRALFATAWDHGRRLVTEDGRPLRIDDVAVAGVVTVFPEGHLEAADSQALLIRLPPNVPLPGPRERTVDGLIAYSKICTHAGCPVGLYEATTHELLCPCHQSTFSVRQGAKPVFGPATRPLPQLPIGLDESGFLVALDDFSEPVGPSFWDRGRG